MVVPQSIFLATSSKSKFAEFSRLSAQFKWGQKVVHLDLKDVEIVEPQCMSVEEVCKFKSKQIAQRYSNLLEKNYLVCEDVSLSLESLNGLPGPFVKFFNEKLGNRLYDVAQKCGNTKASAICVYGLIGCEFNEPKIFFGQVNGDLVEARCSENAFGFDPIFRPDGYEQTYSEMGIEKKNEISHRRKAFDNLVEYLNKCFS